jgi:hypothetical protein
MRFLFMPSAFAFPKNSTIHAIANYQEIINSTLQCKTGILLLLANAWTGHGSF